uniref:Uncharacterized protein n=1 Tax=Timema poppense TaxID=170557 RepID=A0A7R9DE20_TIMPO|nr:unnamed protein product [Timema poppensis]
MEKLPWASGIYRSRTDHLNKQEQQPASLVDNTDQQPATPESWSFLRPRVVIFGDIRDELAETFDTAIELAVSTTFECCVFAAQFPAPTILSRDKSSKRFILLPVIVFPLS